MKIGVVLPLVDGDHPLGRHGEEPCQPLLGDLSRDLGVPGLGDVDHDAAPPLPAPPGSPAEPPARGPFSKSSSSTPAVQELAPAASVKRAAPANLDTL